jgi:hypothetical protein
MYAGLDVSAYLFWNTPLGRAGHEAVDNTIKNMRELLPTHMSGQPTVMQVKGPRKLSIQGGWIWGLAEGQEFYIAEQVEGRAPRTIHDAHTGRPLIVRIGSVKKDASTAWLLGQAPEGTLLQGAVLSRQPLTSAEDLADRDALADIRGDGDGH